MSGNSSIELVDPSLCEEEFIRWQALIALLWRVLRQQHKMEGSLRDMRNPLAMRENAVMNIYWLDSLDHGEDWFVAADNVREAMTFFADDIGYDLVEDEVRAMEVCAVPAEVSIAQAQFLDENQIRACGGQLIRYDDRDLLELVDPGELDSLGVETRIVRFENQIFIEGNVARAALQNLKSRFLL